MMNIIVSSVLNSSLSMIESDNGLSVNVLYVNRPSRGQLESPESRKTKEILVMSRVEFLCRSYEFVCRLVLLQYFY